MTRYPLVAGQAIRYTIGAIILGILTKLEHRSYKPLRARDIFRLIALAATGLAGFNLSLVEALRTASPAAVGVIIGLVPIALALFGPLLDKRLPKPKTLVAAAIVSAGVAIVSGGGGGKPSGFFFATLALIGDSLFSLLAIPLVPRLGPIRLSFYLCSIASVMLWLYSTIFASSETLVMPSTGTFYALVYLGIVVTVGSFIFWYRGMERLPVERVGLFAGAIPIGALGGAALFHTYTGGATTSLGVVVVVVGITLGTISRNTHQVPQRS